MGRSWERRKKTLPTLALLAVVALTVVGCRPGADKPKPSIAPGAGNASPSGSPPTGSSPAPFDEVDEPVALPGLLVTDNEPIANDNKVRTGRLNNGLDYYVRANRNPGGSAEMRLVVNAGSVNEVGAPGVAHFVQHMMFNGTSRYPQNVLNDVLRGFGSSYGADVSGAVTYDESIYQLRVPNTESTLDAGLDVLSQWLTSATFDRAQVEAERGVVLDEWRIRTQSVDGRQAKVAADQYLSSTPYAGRAPIGDEAAINGVSADELRSFYDSWYRPDNAAIVVVGDIDVDQIVGRIQATFDGATSRVPVAPAPPNRSFDGRFARGGAPAFAAVTDADQVTVDIEVGLPLAGLEGLGTATWRAQVLDEAAYKIILRRLNKELAEGTAPFDEVAPGSNSLTRWLDAPTVYVSTDAARSQATLQDVLDAYERASRYGFSDGEVSTAISEMTGVVERQHDGRGTTQDAALADVYVDTFLTGAPYPSPEEGYRLMTSILTSVSSEEVTTRFRARWDNTAPYTIIYAPKSAAGALPTADAYTAMLGALPTRQLDVRTADAQLPAALMQRPSPVQPASTQKLLPVEDPYFNPTMYTYPNGVRVILTSNKIASGQLWFQGASLGGSSRVADDKVPDALIAPEVVTRSGLGSFDASQVATITTGADVQLSSDILPNVTEMSGTTSTSDLEVFLQTVNQTMAAPRFDPLALARVRSQLMPISVDPGIAPELASKEVLAELGHPNQVRYAEILSPAELESVDVDGIKQVWHDLFGNAAGWVFVFAGDVDPAKFLELSNAYLGTLPGVGQAPPPAAGTPVALQGVNATVVRAGSGNTASVTLRYVVSQPDINAADIATADVAQEVIDTRLLRVVTERFGASYSPSSEIEFVMDPGPTVETTVRFTGDPAKIDEVSQLVHDELNALATTGPAPREMDLARAQVTESYNYVDNPTFVRVLLDNALYPTRNVDDFLGAYGAIGSVDAAAVQNYVATHLPTGTYIEVSVVPE